MIKQMRPPVPEVKKSEEQKRSRRTLRRMFPVFLLVILLSSLFFIGTKTYSITWKNGSLAFSASQEKTHSDGAPLDAVFTYKGDNFRTGQNLHETHLDITNVNVARFGKRMSYPVDGFVYAQPLFVPHLLIQGNYHDVVLVATENSSVYAFDADQTKSPVPLWHTSFLAPPNVIAVSNNDIYCANLGSKAVGITGTPVIDPKTQTMYVVTVTKEHGDFFSRLHALDIITGREKPGSPVVITASIPSTGEGSENGRLTFNAKKQNQRAGLLLVNGVVYIAWASHCNLGPYHGWVMGYDAATLQQLSVYNASPNTTRVGIWQSGGGLAADTDGNVYFTTGDGPFSLDKGGQDAGDSILKLSPKNGLQVNDYFTPFNQQCLDEKDRDLGSGGVMLLPSSSHLVTVGKEGRIYVVNRQQMGKFTSVDHVCDKQQLTNIDRIPQEFPEDTITGGVYGSPAYWNGSSGEYVYFSGWGDAVKAFKMTAGRLSTTPASQVHSLVLDIKGKLVPIVGNPVISSNGQKAGTGILWLIDPNDGLRAFDATNIALELYSSEQNKARDHLPNPVKYTVPTVVNGKVFVGTQNSLVIYGTFAQ